MKNPVLLDMKRLSRGKAGIIISILSPIVILLCFAAVIAPVYFDSGDGFEAVLFCEDNDPLTLSVVQNLINTEKSRSVMTLTEVSSLEEGRAHLQSGAACLIHIPQGFQQALTSGNQSSILFYKNASRPLQSAAVLDVLSSGVTLVNEAQEGVNILYSVLESQSGKDTAQKAYGETARNFMLSALNKTAVFETDTVSPLGGLQPVEYYAAALLVVFLSLTALSLYSLTASDISNGIVSRHFSKGRMALTVSAPRVVSGALFVFLQGLPVLLLYMPVCLSSFVYGGSVFLMPLSLITLAFFISSLAFLLSMLVKQNVKTVFLALAFLLFAGGAVIPISTFGSLSPAAAFTPFSAALRMVFDSFFFFEKGGFTEPWLLTSFYAIAFFLTGTALVKRRA